MVTEKEKNEYDNNWVRWEHWIEGNSSSPPPLFLNGQKIGHV